MLVLSSIFTSLTLIAAKSSIPFGRYKRQPQAWWSAKLEEAVSNRCKAFASAHRSNEDREAYISAFRHASSVIIKTKSEAWQATCSSHQNLCILSFVLLRLCLIFSLS